MFSFGKKLPNCLLKQLYMRSISKEGEFLFFLTLQQSVLSLFWRLPVLISVQCYLVLICNSPMVYDTKYMFVCLFIVCMLFDQVSVQIFTHFKWYCFGVLGII